MEHWWQRIDQWLLSARVPAITTWLKSKKGCVSPRFDCSLWEEIEAHENLLPIPLACLKEKLMEKSQSPTTSQISLYVDIPCLTQIVTIIMYPYMRFSRIIYGRKEEKNYLHYLYSNSALSTTDLLYDFLISCFEV